MKIIFSIVVASCLVARMASGADIPRGLQPRPDAAVISGLIQFGMPVAVQPTASKEVRAQAERLAKVLRTPLLSLEKDPTCCFWIELWRPNPTDSGYVVIIQSGGGKLIATDSESLKRAVDRVARLTDDNKGLLPPGVFTNYDVINAK